jgi:membrane dipeptidase
LESLDHWDGLIAQNAQDLLRITRVADFEAARASGRIGLIYGFQNAAQVGSDLDRIDLYARRGVRVVQLTYNDANMIGGGSSGPEDAPLTAMGARLIERLNGARLMVDLSHSCRQTCLDALKASRAPISINHTGCRALSDLPRNKSDEELRDVAQRGGFIGIYFMSFLRPDGHPRAADAADHIVHALKVCGEDHVGIGTDGTATRVDDMAHFRDVMAKDHAARVSAGVAAKGEAADVLPFMEDLSGPAQYARIANLLAGRGVRERVVDKVMGRNFIAYAGRVW